MSATADGSTRARTAKFDQPESRPTVAEALVDAIRSAGVKRMFGIPGGGSNLDLIEAAARAGIDFVLTRSECAAVIMAAVSAELDDTIGVALTGRGPGLANSVNGIAHAALDRVPVLVVTDGLDDGQESFVTHQTFDQAALVAPITKAQCRLEGGHADGQVAELIELARRHPRGPVHIELSSKAAGQPTRPGEQFAVTPDCGASETAVDAARMLLARAERPVVIAGLEVRDSAAATALRALVERLQCPVLTTYKAKGVLPSGHALFAGLFTGGAVEAACVARADLIVLAGLDPVELIPQPWRYAAPVLDIAWRRHATHYVKPDAGLYGRLPDALDRLGAAARPGNWSTPEIAALRSGIETRLDMGSRSGIDARAVIEIAQEIVPTGHRVTVDAGAHMVSAMAYCRCERPFDVLISNGLATMAFALPAAIAAALHDPDRPVIAMTGDGGLLMCLGELATAVQRRCNLLVVVLNDSALSLIDIKQQSRGLQPLGVRWPRFDFARVMEGFGGAGYRASTRDEYRRALTGALNSPMPALVDVSVDPSGYKDQLDALRG